MQNSLIKVGIVGGAGYTGGELLRLLVHHPHVRISFVHSNSQAGKPVTATHTDLVGDTDLVFTNELGTEVDVLFLCVGHGDARKFLDANAIPEEVKIIDLSQDFRLAEKSSLGNRAFVYGLPELNREQIKTAANVANPGCFATAIQLALLPLAQNGSLPVEVHVSGITGSTGAGQKLAETSHFSWRNNNVSSYKVFGHQHLLEITESLQVLQKEVNTAIRFVPYRGNFSRGILCTTYLTSDLSLEEAQQLFRQFYEGHPYTIVTDSNPDLKQVVNTNKCLLYIEKHDDQLVITSLIDNLLKGASGQAVQNMNLLFGLEERAGLQLKAIGF
ncbi:N-acetyl-gamma-glutamyl-phosphate reductase [Rufibacter glacialis]|uniref:N-acetyl-gamma-glutamyl-phosphate reductase n=1 Tax=Rufibacter glacialis TaxID=1259555 RepID=A0A5M8QML1_9BACT|nr:N-acetyl-gamma-glutamyl-phosphate reductase [Rufibacter glacialis]KAA6437457.1 N-acetyl-gamma-glutamyl-phosphate reductase [Rufibacter glacialis]GGK59189.1 N-acetyl-gamma-glutamyl-phosphate reductase [Rufibacter glacialis]